MAATIDTLEGTLDGALWYHYDVGNDVLYVRRSDASDTPTVGEESDDGLIVLRDQATDAIVGLTIVDWWRRFGHGSLPDSLREIQNNIEPLARRIAA